MSNVQTHSTSAVANFARPQKNIRALGLQHNARVADFGAGSGAYALGVAEALEGSGKVYAIDIQRDLLRRIANEAARRGYKNVEIIWADLEAPRASKLADASIDTVLISNLLFQVPDKLLILKEARRIVKPAGTVVVIDWTDSFKGMGPAKEDVFKKEAMLALASEAALELKREFEAGAHHYGCIFIPMPKTS